MSNTKDDLGSELPGEVWHTAMRFTGLAAARRIVWLTKVWRRCKQRMRQYERATEKLAAEAVHCHDMTDAARKEADELQVERDRAERLCREQATLIKQLEERLRLAEQWVESLVGQLQQPVDRSKLPTVPPRVGYRYERRDGTECGIVEDYGDAIAYRYRADDGHTYRSEGDWWRCKGVSALDIVREIGPVQP